MLSFSPALASCATHPPPPHPWMQLSLFLHSTISLYSIHYDYVNCYHHPNTIFIVYTDLVYKVIADCLLLHGSSDLYFFVISAAFREKKGVECAPEASIHKSYFTLCAYIHRHAFY